MEGAQARGIGGRVGGESGEDGGEISDASLFW